jgi:hypothetical protein
MSPSVEGDRAPSTNTAPAQSCDARGRWCWGLDPRLMCHFCGLLTIRSEGHNRSAAAFDAGLVSKR